MVLCKYMATGLLIMNCMIGKHKIATLLLNVVRATSAEMNPLILNLLFCHNNAQYSPFAFPF